MNTTHFRLQKIFILAFVVIMVAACSSSHKPHKSEYFNLDGTYTDTRESPDNRYTAVIQKNSIDFFRTSYKLKRDGAHFWIDSTTVKCGTAIFDKRKNYIEAKTVQNNPIRNVDITYTPAENDSTTLTLRIPNYDFSKGVYPIVNLSVVILRNPSAERGDSDYMETDHYEMDIECRTDSTVVNLPKYMKQEFYFVDIYQSKSINHSGISPFLSKVSYFWGYETKLEEDSKENIIITFPDLTYQDFEKMYFDRVFIPYDNEYLYFFNINLKKNSGSQVVITEP